MTASRVQRSQTVSRETQERLETYLGLLRKWNAKINLVAPASLADGWRRHIEDSLQLAVAAPVEKDWIDLGAGAGLPGLIIAILQIETGGSMTLIDSDARKCAFVREAARAVGARVNVVNTRIEAFAPTHRYDVVTSRALAPLTHLLDYAEPLLAEGGMCLFLKGASASEELTAASARWTMVVDKLPSETQRDAAVLRIREFARRAPE